MRPLLSILGYDSILFFESKKETQRQAWSVAEALGLESRALTSHVICADPYPDLSLTRSIRGVTCQSLQALLLKDTEKL